MQNDRIHAERAYLLLAAELLASCDTYREQVRTYVRYSGQRHVQHCLDDDMILPETIGVEESRKLRRRPRSMKRCGWIHFIGRGRSLFVQEDWTRAEVER